MSRHLLFAALCASLVAAGCSDAVGPGGKSSDLAINRQKWASHGYTSYSFTMQRFCFCALAGPMRVYVVNDTVIDVRRISDNTKIDPQYVETIPVLFHYIEAGQTGTGRLDVTYDPTLGFPSRIYSDPLPMAADDESTIIVSDVAPPVEFVVE